MARPRRTLRQDPDRYEIAYYVGRMCLPTAPLKTPLAVFIMQVRHGVFVDDAEHADIADAILEGRELPIEMTKKRGRASPDREQWRDRSSANAVGANFATKVNRLLEKLFGAPEKRADPSMADDATDDQKDAAWLSLMSTAWRIAIGYYNYTGDPIAAARDLAIKAGEVDYFERIILPQFRTHEFLHVRK